MHDVAVLHDILGAFQAHAAGVFCALLAAMGDKIGKRDRLGPDESFFEIGMDAARGLWLLGAPLHRPGMGFLWADSKKRNQIEERVAGSDHPYQTRLVEPERCQKL